MGKMQKLALFLLMLMVSISLLGCGGSEVSSGKVYFLLHNDAGGGFNEDLKQALLKKAQEGGVAIEVLDGKGDTNLQLDQMNEVIASKAGAVVLAAMDGDAIIPAVKKANEAGIPIIRVSRDINDGQFVSCLSDDREAGKMQGEFMAKNLPPNAQILYMSGEMTQGAAIKRWEGFKEACLDKRPDVKLLASADCGWNKTDALKQMTLWLKIYPQIDGVVGANDEMVLGAIQSLKDNNRLNGVWTSGVDATDNALKAVQAGLMSQTVKQDAVGQGEGAFQLVQAALTGNKSAADVVVPFVSITRDNIGQFLK
ncbi:putative D-ribose-binding periplasmic protein [Selenomonas ruminantium subsp. lactilytica TAM6421]|uniref:Putative D-ribose-binding periplasmic protein n=1 Tax=Selenomonas ruminantium subsp. lactilytica (strain NBRC 103574 / TAM6421) TaxID=927704 RepID=I0GNJ2_SELRL|nr:sugar ABC transporter substrate-binding protein [Selenomonas ruminantium]BAL82329.1 putative D-ribose-binding periplasmic protein [Selenomonas ruminantium subsp. lactilytica TAM6421]